MESEQGHVTEVWDRGEPRPGYYYLKLECGFCRANNGYIYPEAGAPDLGATFVAPPGTQVGVCQRCGKSNRCVVMSRPRRPKPKPREDWAW